MHLCQKKEYDLAELRKKQDTFLEGILADMLRESGDRKYRGLRFEVRLLSDAAKEQMSGAITESITAEEEELKHCFDGKQGECEFVTTNLEFIRR